MPTVNGLTQLHVHSADPVLACLASQYAGWSLSHGEGKDAFRALASGPGRAIARRETLYDELDYADRFDRAVFVLEVDRVPPAPLIEKVARDCDLPAERVSFILTPTRSLAGTVQIVARVLEVALHKAHALHFPLDRIVDGAGVAPLPPPAADFLSAMGRTNDAILFGGSVTLFVDASDDQAQPTRRHASRVGLARLRQALRADLQGFRIRLLPDRPDAVRAGRGPGVQPRLRRELPRRSARRRAPGGVVRAVSPPPRVAILTDEPGWHGRRLARALAALGARGRVRVVVRLPRGSGGEPLGHRRPRLRGAAARTAYSCARSPRAASSR